MRAARWMFLNAAKVLDLRQSSTSGTRALCSRAVDSTEGKGYKRNHDDGLLPELSHCCLLLLRDGALWRT